MKKKELIKQLFADTCVIVCAVSGEAVFLPSDAEIVKDEDGDYQFEDGDGGTAWLTQDDEVAQKVIWFEQKGVAVVGEWKGQFIGHRGEGIMVEDLAHKLTKMSQEEREEFLKRGEARPCGFLTSMRTECAPNIGGIQSFITPELIARMHDTHEWLKDLMDKHGDRPIMDVIWEEIAELENQRIHKLMDSIFSQPLPNMVFMPGRCFGKRLLTGHWIDQMEKDMAADAELVRMAGEDQSQACGEVSEALYTIVKPEQVTDGGDYGVVCTQEGHEGMKVKAAVYALFKPGGDGVRFILNGKNEDGLVICSQPEGSVQEVLNGFKSHGGKVYAFKNRTDLNTWLSLPNN